MIVSTKRSDKLTRVRREAGVSSIDEGRICRNEALQRLLTFVRGS